jgi:hypothetical protein
VTTSVGGGGGDGTGKNEEEEGRDHTVMGGAKIGRGDEWV